MVVFHGGMGLDHTYLRAIDPLADIVRLVYFDAVGHGQSAPPADWGTVTLETWAETAEALRTERGIDRWLVFGHSYGAFLALTYALRHRDRVAGLVLSNSAASFRHRDLMFANVMKRATPDLAATFGRALAIGPSSDEEMREGWPKILPLYFHRWEPRYLDAFARTRFSAAGYKRGNALLGTYDVTGRLAELPPALVVSGDDDFMTPADLGARIAAAAPQARHAIIAESGHFPFIERPDHFFEAVRGFLHSAAML